MTSEFYRPFGSFFLIDWIQERHKVMSLKAYLIAAWIEFNRPQPTHIRRVISIFRNRIR